MELKKIKPKKKSLTSQIKKLKEENKRYYELIDKRWDQLNEIRNELREIEKVFPKKYFKIKYKIKANNEVMFPYEETIESFSLSLAIIKIKKNKTFPESFELVDVVAFG
jgi:predicted  nucleic acid-binding Zn-ribbon protein